MQKALLVAFIGSSEKQFPYYYNDGRLLGSELNNEHKSGGESTIKIDLTTEEIMYSSQSAEKLAAASDDDTPTRRTRMLVACTINE